MTRHSPFYAAVAQRGFSLVEMALALGLSGILLGGIWQVVGMSSRAGQQQVVASQALSVASAGQSYIRNNNAALLALTSLNSIGSVARIRVINSDTGEATVPSLMGAAYLPSNFINSNSFGQSYAFYVRREDGGVAGVDAADRLVGLVISTGGQTVPDIMGAAIAGSMGAAGGFIYSDSNPASPTAATTAAGAAGGWTAALNTDWASIGTTATAGHVAILTNLLPYSAVSSGGASSIDGLDDGKTDYATGMNLFMGNNAGDSIASGGNNNTGTGISAMRSLTTASDNTAFGYQALRYYTTGSENVAIGKNAMSGSGGTPNQTQSVAIGVGAGATALGSNFVAIGYAVGSGSSGSIGRGTVAIGSEAMRYSQAQEAVAIGLLAGNDGYQSISIGPRAGIGGSSSSAQNIAIGGAIGSADGIFTLLTSGSRNIAMGASNLRNTTTGNDNIGIGHMSLYSNSAGSESVAIGTNSMLYANNSTSNFITYNTALGSYALRGSITPGNNIGTHNTALGHSSMMLNTGGSYNTAVGMRTLYNNTTGSANVAIGGGLYSIFILPALEANTTGSNNIAVGNNALSKNTTGSTNTAMGYGALQSNISGDNNTAVGELSLNGGTTISQNTALGVEALKRTTSDNNAAVGYGALFNNTTGTGNVALGYQAGNTNTPNATGDRNTYIGNLTGATANNFSNSTALGSNALLTESNQVVLGNSSIGKISAQVTSITAISDARHKHDVSDLPLGLDFISKLHPVQYRLNENGKALRYGFLAQEVEKVLPTDLATQLEKVGPDEGIALINRDRDNDRTYHMAYGELIAPLVKAVQELNDENSTLKAQINQQNSLMLKLEARLHALEAAAAPH